jgi:diguanylate cyclase (GGDEF)-like protein
MINLIELLKAEEISAFKFNRSIDEIKIINSEEVVDNKDKSELENYLINLLRDKFFICENNCEGEYFDVFDFKGKLIRIKWKINGDTAVGSLRINSIYTEKEEILKVNRMKDFLIDISQQIVEYEDINELLKKILINTMDIMEVSKSGSILLLDEDTGCMTPNIIIGLDDESKNLKIKPEETYHFVANEGRYDSTVVVQDLIKVIKTSDKFRSEIYTDEGELIRSSISAPLFINGKRYGSINIDSTKLAPFSEFHKVMMNYLAKEVELIIERFRMIEEIKFLSNHDFLTGLGNRKSLYKYLNKKVTEEKPFYFVQIDLNNFKYINDNYGHLAGDEAIKSFSEKLKKLETSYEAVRLGGDEFALIYEEKNKMEIEEELKNLQGNCKKEGLRIPSNKKLSCGFSWGIAKYPDDGKNIEEIYAKSDKLLYKVKKRTLRRRKTDE